MCLFLIICNSALPQEDTSTVSTETLLENIYSGEEAETEVTEYPDILEEFALHPININNADLNQLQTIPYLDAASAKKIIEHREHHGKYFSKSELYSVEGLTPELVSQLKSFITVEPYKFPVRDTLTSFIAPSPFHLVIRNRIIKDLQDRKGYINKRYSGNSYKIYNRILFSYGGNISAAILAEKDPGESAVNDFMSFNVSLGNYYYLEHITAGDYNIENGQGLVNWTPYGINKTAGVLTSTKKPRGIVPSYSANETAYLRGLAAKLKYDDIGLIIFFSNKDIDAVVDSSGLITSTPVDGYHRTNSELKRKNRVHETIFGSGMDYYPFKILHLNCFYTRTQFNHLRLIENEFRNSFQSASFSYDYFPGNLNFSGEAAYNGITAAAVNNIYISINKNLKLVNSIRIYPEGFFSFHGTAFGEQSGMNINETGFYSGINYHTSFGQINIYFDQFNILSGTGAFPLQGKEWFADLKIKYKPVELNIVYKRHQKESASSSGLITEKTAETYKFETVYTHSKNLRIRTRLAYKKIFHEPLSSISEGYMLFQDIHYNFAKKIQIYGRAIFFISDDYESAVYQFENDLPGMFRNYALYGEGFRWYLLMKYVLEDGLMLSFKYSETYKPKEQFLSSGDAEIKGNRDNEIEFQIDYEL